MSVASKRPSEGPVVAAFLVSIAGALGLAVVYALGGDARLEGTLLALALGGIGVGLVSWSKRFMPTKEAVEERPALQSREEEVAAFTDTVEQGALQLGRRGVLAKLALGAFGALGVALLFPLRSLGPRPGRGLKQTEFAAGGVRLVGEDGQPIRPDQLDAGALLTAFPEGKVQDNDAPTLLIRVDEGELRLSPEKAGWTVGGIVAYSKLCTHLGCPVGLYQQEEKLLLCPCHQSTFDVLDGAKPVFGPAARPLPQLPLAVDEVGYLVATGDFEAPVAGGFWDRGR